VVVSAAAAAAVAWSLLSTVAVVDVDVVLRELHACLLASCLMSGTVLFTLTELDLFWGIVLYCGG
jgi:hypothetical protein